MMTVKNDCQVNHSFVYVQPNFLIIRFDYDDNQLTNVIEDLEEAD